jgi:hypothetical protein
MAAHAGEKAQKGHTIPKCPNGHSEFETRTT